MWKGASAPISSFALRRGRAVAHHLHTGSTREYQLGDECYRQKACIGVTSAHARGGAGGASAAADSHRVPREVPPLLLWAPSAQNG